jgi:hypothetical protein
MVGPTISGGNADRQVWNVPAYIVRCRDWTVAEASSREKGIRGKSMLKGHMLVNL